MKASIFLGLLLSIMAGCQEAPKHFFGHTGMIVLKEPAKIEAWRIHSTGGAETATPAKELDVALAKQLADILEDSSTFNFQSAKACKFDPIVGFRLTRERRTIDVILCFTCNELKLVSPDPVNKKYPSRVADVEPGRAALLKFVKQAFANDAEIQAIK